MASSKKETDKRFSRFGVVSFTATSKVNDFVDYLEKGKLAGTRCKTCDTTFFPPRAHCHKCLEKGEMEWFEVEGTGRLMTYSVLQYAPVGFQDQVPYAIAVADYGDFKIFGRIKDIPEGGIPIGAEIRAVVRSLPDDRFIYEFVTVMNSE